MALFILTPMRMQTYFPKLLPMECGAKCYTSNNLRGKCALSKFRRATVTQVSVNSHSLGKQI